MLEGTLKCKFLTELDWLNCRMKVIAVTAASTPKILKVSMDSFVITDQLAKMAQLSSSCMLMNFTDN